jgi:NADH dehydrogenase
MLGERRIPAVTTLWAAGVQASPLARSLGMELDRAGRVRVEADLSLPGRPEAFVIGDLALFTHQGDHPLPGVAPVAIQQGTHAAENVLRRVRGESTQPFHYVDKGNLATIGRAAAVAHIGRLKIAGLAAWLAWLFVHVWYLIGFRNRAAVMMNWAWSYIRSKRAARLITGHIEKESARSHEEESATDRITSVRRT